MEYTYPKYECPYCNNIISPEATACKHCQRHFVRRTDGYIARSYCPYCKEEIVLPAVYPAQCPMCSSLIMEPLPDETRKAHEMLNRRKTPPPPSPPSPPTPLGLLLSSILFFTMGGLFSWGFIALSFFRTESDGAGYILGLAVLLILGLLCTSLGILALVKRSRLKPPPTTRRH